MRRILPGGDLYLRSAPALSQSSMNHDSPRILSLRAEYFRLPLKHPFVLSIRTATNANVVRWYLETTIGNFLGECVPVQYVTGETPESVLDISGEIERALVGARIADWLELTAHLAREFPHHVAARAGAEIALYNAYAYYEAVPLHALFGSHTASIVTDLTLSRVPDAPEIAEAAWAQGFRVFKQKVGGGDISEDVARISAIAERLPNACFRLDANQALTVSSALELIDILLSLGIRVELIEQPVPKEDIESLHQIAVASPIPVIADEACCSAADALRLFNETAVQGVNVKLMKSGIRGALQIIELAKERNKLLMLGCMLESEVGMAASVALAIGSQAFDFHDLDGHLLLDLAEPIALFSAQGPRLGLRE
jgi:L-alanine-DL-glutamate epimerase-like enolase superfamily enzyme